MKSLCLALTFLSLSAWPASGPFKEYSIGPPGYEAADFTQAEVMLRLLQSPAPDRISSGLLERALNAYGTLLIIRQQNISRLITRDQYRAVLVSLDRQGPPEIAPADSSERAKRGAEGLRKDVWPALRWAEANVSLLAERVGEIKRLDLLDSSRALAARYLPERVDLRPRLYIVMGGRAGAATLDGGDIYFDVLATSYRAAIGVLKYPTPAQINEYYAHEIHHLGLSQILDSTRGRLRLSDREQRAFTFLTALVMEGSASYLINGNRSLGDMRRDPQFTENLNRGDELLRLGEQVLRDVLESGLGGDAYEKAVAPFLGTGWHSAGAIMLAAIDEASGLNEVMKVQRDPRNLPAAYNKAVARLKSGVRRPRFDARLAERILSMGR